MSETKVVYDFDLHTVGVEILIESVGEIGPQVFAALPVLLRGDWTVTWTLKAGNGILSVMFTGGIKIIEGAPPLLSNVPLADIESALSRAIFFTNDCESAQEVKYNIIGEATVANTDPKEHFRFDFLENPENFHHDPTIAVVTDPIGG
jgi:hypothetical protein